MMISAGYFCLSSSERFNKQVEYQIKQIVKANTMVAQTKADIIPLKPRLSVAGHCSCQKKRFA
ncbi:hypothetical protein T12_880 [Trichinella patagoniensis]|uniref:Uncharacterized protein n=1 Tax=Trichinella patagoniensis TaxID=990121 RepID=A0A0V0ZW17_9BILA|nr:hypothetical protein T12_880 [Trichinella patagoniensis]